MNNYHKYFHISPVEEKWGLYVNTAGYARVNPNSSYPVVKEHPRNYRFNWDKGRTLNGYYLIFICKGSGVFESEHTKITRVREGTCFFLYPGVWHRYKPDLASGWEEYWVGFDGAYPSDLMHKGFFTAEQPCMNVGLNANLLNLYQKLIDSISLSSTAHNQVIAGIALQILGMVNMLAMQKDPENDLEGLISKARFKLQASLDKPLDMELLAQSLPMGYSAFRRTFKEQVGISPNQYHMNLRLSKARELLESTNLRINEIAGATGFDSLFYFSKLFKKKNGCSPRAFRYASRTGPTRPWG